MHFCCQQGWGEGEEDSARPQVITQNKDAAPATGGFFVVVTVVPFLAIVTGFYCRLKRYLKSHPLSFLLCFEGKGSAQPTSGETLILYHFTLHYNRSCVTPKDAFDFKVLVIYLCNTHVKLEIHLSLSDNNVQNGASCMSHYLRPGVVLLMNMHEPRQGEERFAQPVSRWSLGWFSSVS